MGTLRLHYEETNILMPIGAFFFTQTQSDQNPHTKSAIFSTLSSTFLTIGGDRNNNIYFFGRPGPCLIE